MQTSKLVRLFSTLSSYDRLAFEKFLHSPYFNQREDVIRLFDLLCQTPVAELEKEAVFSQLFPEQSYDDQQLRLVMSYLFRLLEHFLLQETLQTEEFASERQLMLLSAYRKNQPARLYTQQLRKAERRLERSDLRQAEFYYQKYRLRMERFRRVSTEKPSGELHQQELSDTLDVAYMALKLRQACLLLSQQKVYEVRLEYRADLLPEILQYVERADLLHIPAIGLYYYCYQMTQQPQSESYFQQFKQELLDKGGLFPLGEIRDLYLLAINYCVRQINEGETTYYNAVLDLYKGGLQGDYLLENGILSRFTFHNIVTAGLRTGEFDWVETFIAKYQKNLDRPHRQSSVSYSRAQLAYHRRDFDAAMALLQKFNYRDVLLNLGAKTVLLKIYYELDEFDLLLAHLEAMEKYIRRKRVIGYHRSNYRNIVAFTKRLIQLNIFDKIAVDELRKAIDQEEILTEREWLLEQL